MKYFLHDTSAFDDEKITELFLKFGYKGLGLFYTTLEKIAKQEKPIKTDVLKTQLKVGKRLEKCWQFMEQIGLIVSSNGESFNENLMFRCRLYDTQKLSTRKRVAEFRERQKDKKNVTRYNRVSNACKVNKVNKEEEEIFKEEKMQEEKAKKRKEELRAIIEAKYKKS